MTTATPMFLADPALGRLATWLRLLGFDTAYDRRGGEAHLLNQARAEGRILLTRNRRIQRRRQPPTLLLIESDHFRDQVRAVLRHFALDPLPHFLSRCSRCNVVLTSLEGPPETGEVPPYVRATQADFARCPSCRRVYWPATHVERMRRELAQLADR
jgi:uncharacterized protein with PIN domain